MEKPNAIRLNKIVYYDRSQAQELGINRSSINHLIDLEDKPCR